MFRWVYEQTTGQFLYGGPCEQAFDSLTHGVVLLAKHPDRRTERYDGAWGVRPATAQEVSEYDAAQLDERTQGRFNDEKLVKALAIWTAGKLNVPRATARQEILEILRTL